jgi:hypothetical protein
VRSVALSAARTAGIQSWDVSFKGTLQTMHEFLARFQQAPSLEQWVDDWLATTAQIRVGHRPDRIDADQLAWLESQIPWVKSQIADDK